METIACNECGCVVAEDDFILQQCPNCDGYLPFNKLNRHVETYFRGVIRVSPVQKFELVVSEDLS